MGIAKYKGRPLHRTSVRDPLVSVSLVGSTRLFLQILGDVSLIQIKHMQYFMLLAASIKVQRAQ